MALFIFRTRAVGGSMALLLFLSLLNAQTSPTVKQAPLWAGKPDIPAFEKLENDRLERAQRSIDQILAVAASRYV